MAPSTCVACSAETEAVHRLCEACLAERTAAERAAQGLPPTIEDPDTLAKIAVHTDLGRRAPVKAAS